jgi:hypothetical protein
MENVVPGASVLQVLRASEEPLAAMTIARTLAADRQSVNRALYSLLEDGEISRLDGSPPRWRARARSPEAAPEEPGPLVVVDLGNCHDCLAKVLPYARDGLVEVEAYADRHFNGFGVNPPLEEPGVRVIRARTTERNAADVELIWRLAVRLSAEGPRRRVVVCSKDQGFRSLSALAEERGHRLLFVPNWQELRLHVE